MLQFGPRTAFSIGTLTLGKGVPGTAIKLNGQVIKLNGQFITLKAS